MIKRLKLIIILPLVDGDDQTENFLGAVGRFRFGPVISKVYAPPLSTTSAEIHLLGLPDISQLRSIPRWGMRLELGTGKKNKHARSVIITTADRRDVYNKVATNILFVIVFFFWTLDSHH